MFVVPSTRTRTPPTYSRRYGRKYRGLDSFPDASLCTHELGKVRADCRLRVSKSRWGHLGHEDAPAGIVYMDLSFDQPHNYRLASARVVITLEDIHPDEITRGRQESDLYPLQITEHYGPKHLTGEATNVVVSKTLHLTPEFNFLGTGGGGLGINSAKSLIYNSRWTFKGQRHVVDAGPEYRTLEWELCENQEESRPSHPNVINTAFTFQHNDKPFRMRVDIKGRLQSTRHRIQNKMRNLRFPPHSEKDQGSSEVLVRPRDHAHPLDSVARGLERALERENYMRIPVEVPEALPVTFADASSVSGYIDAADENASSGSLLTPGEWHSGQTLSSASSSTTLVNEPHPTDTAMITDSHISELGSAIHQFHESPNTKLQKSPIALNYQNLRSEDQRKDAMVLLSRYPALLALVHMLVGVLGLFSTGKAVPNSPNK